MISDVWLGYSFAGFLVHRSGRPLSSFRNFASYFHEKLSPTGDYDCRVVAHTVEKFLSTFLVAETRDKEETRTRPSLWLQLLRAFVALPTTRRFRLDNQAHFPCAAIQRANCNMLKFIRVVIIQQRSRINCCKSANNYIKGRFSAIQKCV